MRIAIVIPTLNAGTAFKDLLREIDGQNISCIQKIIVDSGSSDCTVNLARQHQYEIIELKQSSFNHGRTRQICIEKLEATVDIVVFITQDVRFCETDTLAKLTAYFQDSKVGAAYGRQLPYKDASPLAAQARLFNYPDESRIKTYADKEELGIKAPFLSDSFAAYRLSALQAVGGFVPVIVSEDMYIGAKILKYGGAIAYAAEAKVYHSHNYTLLQEFRRYFDTGVFQSDKSWIRKEFGRAEREGFHLVLNQLIYLWEHDEFLYMPKAMAANVIRFLGYRIGLYERHLSQKIKRICSGQPYFFAGTKSYKKHGEEK